MVLGLFVQVVAFILFAVGVYLLYFVEKNRESNGSGKRREILSYTTNAARKPISPEKIEISETPPALSSSTPSEKPSLLDGKNHSIETTAPTTQPSPQNILSSATQPRKKKRGRHFYASYKNTDQLYPSGPPIFSHVDYSRERIEFYKKTNRASSSSSHLDRLFSSTQKTDVEIQNENPETSISPSPESSFGGSVFKRLEQTNFTDSEKIDPSDHKEKSPQKTSEISKTSIWYSPESDFDYSNFDPSLLIARLENHGKDEDDFPRIETDHLPRSISWPSGIPKCLQNSTAFNEEYEDPPKLTRGNSLTNIFGSLKRSFSKSKLLVREKLDSGYEDSSVSSSTTSLNNLLLSSESSSNETGNFENDSEQFTAVVREPRVISKFKKLLLPNKSSKSCFRKWR